MKYCFFFGFVFCGLTSRPLDFIIGTVYIFHIILPSQSGAVAMYLAAKEKKKNTFVYRDFKVLI